MVFSRRNGAFSGSEPTYQIALHVCQFLLPLFIIAKIQVNSFSNYDRNDFLEYIFWHTITWKYWWLVQISIDLASHRPRINDIRTKAAIRRIYLQHFLQRPLLSHGQLYIEYSFRTLLKISNGKWGGLVTKDNNKDHAK